MSLPPDTPPSPSSQKKEDQSEEKEVDLIQGRKNKRLRIIDSPIKQRQENLFKNRNEVHRAAAVAGSASFPAAITIEDIPALTKALLSSDPNAQLKATCQFGKLLSTGQISLIDEVIRAGVVPQLVKFFTRDDKPDLQTMAASTLTKFASGTSEHKKIVFEHIAVPFIVKLLSSSTDDFKEIGVIALGIFASDSPSRRDDVLNHGALSPLLSLLSNPSTLKLSILKTSTWTLLNLFRGDPPPPPTFFKQIHPALSVFRELLLMDDEDVVLNACWTLSFLSREGSSEMIKAIHEANVFPPLVELLLRPTSEILEHVLLTLGNIAAVDDAGTQIVIDSGALPYLKLLLTKSDENILKNACWTISNITSGIGSQIHEVIEAGLISPLIRLIRLMKAANDVSKEAVWAIVNATEGSSEQIEDLVSEGCIEALCDLLTCTNLEIVTKCLVGLENILNAGEIYKKMVDECGGLEKIESLRSCDNNEIYGKVVDILETYWHKELDQNLHDNRGGGFNFSEKTIV